MSTYVGNNAYECGESLGVCGANEFLLRELTGTDPLPDADGYEFMDVLSAEQIKPIYFDEGAGGHDICI